VLALGLALLAGLTVLRAFDPAPLQGLRDLYFDGLQRLSPREPADLPVRVVDIDEASLQAIGQWPWPRDQMAELVDRLAALGVAVIAIDVLFPEADRMSPASIARRLDDQGLLAATVSDQDLAGLDSDLAFATAIAQANVVLGTSQSTDPAAPPVEGKAGFVEIGLLPSASLPGLPAAVPILPPLREAATGIGVINISPFDAATVIRRVPLVWRGPLGLLPTFSVEALRVALGETTYQLMGSPDLEGVVEALRLADFTIPTTPDGSLWVHYRPDSPDLYVSALEVLRGGNEAALAERLAGSIVLIGSSAAGLLDLRTTALGENVPGVSIHAQMLEQILTGDYLRRDALVEAVEIIAFLGLGLAVIGVMSISGPLASMATGFAAAVLVTLGSWVAFTRYGLLFDAVFPLAAGFVVFAALSAFQFVVADRDKRMIRRSFSHYVAPSVLQQIEQSGHRLALGGEIRTVTVMFADIRDFTPLSELVSATELVELLNRLFTDLGDQILRHQGTIDKFIGDAVMAFWNAPLLTEDHPARAGLAALDMRAALARFNTAGLSPRPVNLAIGVATGAACVGNIGSRDRFNYTAVGETVNQAARIEGGCRRVAYDILFAEASAAKAPGLAWLPAGNLRLKGVTEPVAASILVGGPAMAGSADFAALRSRHGALLRALTERRAWQPRLEECEEIALTLEPGLGGFYAAIADRLADFA
jgi:adenylate cyclase